MKKLHFPDRQRALVYKWENLHFQAESSPRVHEKIAREHVTAVFAHFSLPPPIIVFSGERAHSAQSQQRGNVIRLPNWALTFPIITHECAHSLTRTLDAHGPQFVRNYIELMALFCGKDRRLALESAAQHYLAVMPETKFWVRETVIGDLADDIMARL